MMSKEQVSIPCSCGGREGLKVLAKARPHDTLFKAELASADEVSLAMYSTITSDLSARTSHRARVIKRLPKGNVSFSNCDLGGSHTCSDFQNSQYPLATGSEGRDSLIEHAGGSGPDRVEEIAALESGHHVIGEEWLYGCL